MPDTELELNKNVTSALKILSSFIGHIIWFGCESVTHVACL